MKYPFSIIEGGLATLPETRRATAEEKVIRFEFSKDDSETPTSHGSSGLRALDDADCFGLMSNEPAACILDFEYNGVPARHGFLRD